MDRPTAGTASPSALPAGVSVELRQLRSDVAARWAQVMITNDGETDVTVGPLHVDDPRFDGSAGRINDRESTVRAGSTVAIPVQLPPVACPAPDEATGTVTLEWATTDASGTATAPLTDPLSFVPPLHERECRALALAATAAVSISAFTPSPAGQPADLTLTVAPTGEGAARIEGIHSTNLLTWSDHPNVEHPLGIDIASGGAEPFDVHLPMIPLRCDPHAVQEDKRGTVFNVDIAVDGEPGQIQLAASEEMRGRILTWVGQWCGFPH
ncbi:hypothetical protein [Microbacterium sp. BK668]|uniref:hypothetical protein n=1 Tax=Microbacterium sp. BK668 TaxID=2512118 RepID=UPI00105D0345|nr:hypothetical protein [Microbacterium sp. BK668]TDN91312.1 hypothetical protein EV279_0811 [Microbacterium sp. BK668]